MRNIRTKLTYANVVATMALFISLGGGAYAAHRYLVTSTKQIKPSVLKKLRGGTGARGPAGPKGDTGAKGDPGPSTGPAGGVLSGTYPNPGLAPPEAFHLVGAPGEPGFLNAWVAFGAGDSTPGFYKDAFGIVHLKGTFQSGTASNTATGDMFILPAGYRPAEKPTVRWR